MKPVYAIIIFALIVMAFFHNVLVGSDVFLTTNTAYYDPWKTYASDEDRARNTYWEDPLLTYLPRHVLLNEAIRSGRLPLWNPYIYSGMPFLADPQTRVLYPVELLLVALDPGRAMAYDAAIHVFLAMLGMYLFLRRLDVGGRGSLLGACAYAFSSFFYFRYAFPTLIASAAWIPFYFYGFEVARRSPRRGILLLTVFFALGYLAGFPQVFLFGVCAVVFYGIYVSLTRAYRGRLATLFGTCRIFCISGLLAALVVSVQLVPFLELARNAIGLHYPAEHVTTIFVNPPAVLLRSVFPTFFGNPVQGTSWSDLPRELIHPYNPDFAFYCGAGALLLGLAAVNGVRRFPRIGALVVLLVLSVSVALSGVLLRVAYQLMPMFRASRTDRVSVLACFALSAMAGFGFSMICRERKLLGRHLKVVVLAMLGLVLITALGLELAGEAVFEQLAEKVRSFPDEHWKLISNYTRSGRVKEWAEEDLAGWMSYERRQVLHGAVVMGVSSALILMWAGLGSGRRRLRWVMGLLIVLLVAVDVTAIARTYYLTQPEGTLWETEGIKRLRSLLQDRNAWRIKTVRQTFEDEIAFPPNINQVFALHSVEGKGTVFPGAYGRFKRYRMDSEGTVDSHAGRRAWLASPADDIMGVRFLIARQSEPRFSYRPFFRSVATHPSRGSLLRVLSLNHDSRLALCQEADETCSLEVYYPPVGTLAFEVGFTSDKGSPGDSIFFQLTGEAKSGTLKYTVGYDLEADRDRWHPVELDISALKISAGRIATTWISSEAADTDALTGGLSRPEHVVRHLPAEAVEGGYRIDATRRGGALSLKLESPSREVPLEIAINDRPAARRRVIFPDGTVSRAIWIGLRSEPAQRVVIRSDSVFTVFDCRQVWRGWPKRLELDCEVLYDRDMCIYENSSAIEKGICLDKNKFEGMRDLPTESLPLGSISDIDSIRCGECTVLAYRPEKVELGVETDRACYVVFQDMHYPGWKAYVDGSETEILKTDIGVRALEVSKGTHRVTMVFRPLSFRIGLMLTCAGLVLTLLFGSGRGLAVLAPRVQGKAKRQNS